MTRCKMDKPERADFFRVFARHMLVDEDYEHLSREEWGSVFLLMLHQWSKGGTLPADPRKLAGLARCSENELADLLEKWPKLEVVEGTVDRVGIPYLLREWSQVMGFYEAQTQRSALGVAARLSKGKPMGNPAVTHGSPTGLPVGLPNQDQDKEVPPLSPPSGGEPVGRTREGGKRRTKGEILSGFSTWTQEVLEALIPSWHREDGPDNDRREIRVSVPATGDVLEEIHRAHPALPAELTITAAKRYLAEERMRYKSPEYFFGPKGPWKGYINTELRARELRAQRPAEPAPTEGEEVPVG